MPWVSSTCSSPSARELSSPAGQGLMRVGGRSTLSQVCLLVEKGPKSSKWNPDLKA